MNLPGLTTTYIGRSWLPLESVGSTNDYCKTNAPKLAHGTVVTTGNQTAGKGRLGRRWEDTAEKGLAMSVLLHDWPVEQLGLLPLLAGMAVCEGLGALCGVDCRIKWSNDVLVDSKKLCGILCESRISGDDAFAVIGIGVNLAHSQQDWDRLGLVYAASLFSVTGKKPAAEETASALCNALELQLELFRKEGFPSLRERYKQLCVTLNKPVRVLWQGEERRGVAVDVDETGALLCDIDGQLCAVNAGEASVRGIYGYV